MLALTRGLANQGHQVTVLYMNTLKHHTDPSQIPPEITGLASFRGITVPAALSPVKALLNLLFSREPYIAVRFLSPDFRHALIRLLKEKEYDIIQLEGLYLCPYIPAIRANSSAKIAYRSHNIESEIWMRSALLSSGLKRWYLLNLASRLMRFEKKWINHYDLLVPITGRDEQELNRMGNKKPSLVTPGGINPDSLSEYDEPVEFPSVFHIGSLEWSPNQEGLLWFLKNVWEELAGRYPALRFYIAGRNAPSWLVAAIDKPGVVFLGEVDDAYRFMASKTVMVVPLLSGSGMRIKIIEGMALGKPILSTPLGAEGLPVTHGSDILLADNPETFIDHLSQLVRNQDLCLSLGNNARAFVARHFDNQTICGRLADFYQQNL